MTIAFVLGNGISRQAVSLTALSQCGKIYGCNALYREFTPDVLVATDQPIAEQIQNSGYSAKHKFYTRKPLPNLGALRIPEAYHGYSSGPAATGIAAVDGHHRIYLLGFDLGPTENNTFNNIYADTEFYKTSAHPPTFTGNWVRQLVSIMNTHRQVQFIRVQGTTTASIDKLEQVKNLTHLDINTFIDRINNKKDL
jgi:hypothetical protein